MALSRLQWQGSEEKVQETESDFQHDGGGREWRDDSEHQPAGHLRLGGEGERAGAGEVREEEGSQEHQD